ncbi:F-box/WD-40 repeat-containing protein 1 [Cardamine amara subsp. amara]|uniref:F-box/WD-40 repeat-containing protein 1 n=1 Tax=Cardamine amara subsp. amara TaxID=228776 RepID=A0ABD1A7W6_CARAN
MASSSERSLLPFELMEEILWRVPAESLTRFKLTCKRWLALFKDKKFINNHLDLVQEHFIRINHIVQIINQVTQAHSSLPIPHKLQDKINISSMVQCDGLLQCKLQFCKLAIWNPFFHSYNPYSVND